MRGLFEANLAGEYVEFGLKLLGKQKICSLLQEVYDALGDVGGYARAIRSEFNGKP